MQLNRYIIVQAIKTNKGELIPIWDERLNFTILEDMGETLRFGNRNYYDTVECIYDLQTKNLSTGIDIDYIPSETEFQKGETVYYEISHRILGESKIVDIKFEKFETSIIRGSKLDEYYKNKLNLIDIVSDNIYCLKSYNPTYVLENGVEIDYEYKLNHKKIKEWKTLLDKKSY